MSQPALKTLSKSVIKEAALILTIALLSIGGAVLFYAIEGGVEASAKNEIKNLKGDLVKKLVQKSGLGKARAVEFKKETNKVFQEFEEQLLEAYNSGSLSSETSETVWSFTGSLFYVGTVFTTVGYGNIYPTTTLGKLLTIAYASVTIPLVLIFLDALGKIFTRILKAVPEMGRVFYYSDVGVVLRKAPGVSAVADKFAWPAERPDCAGRPLLELIDEALAKADESFDLPLAPALAVLTAYTAGGALMYSLWEDLDFLDAFYFVFITISTIGFGDVLPEYPALMILTSLYVFVGLGVCSMVINVIVEVLQRLMPTTRIAALVEKVCHSEDTVATNIEEDLAKTLISHAEPVNEIVESSTIPMVASESALSFNGGGDPVKTEVVAEGGLTRAFEDCREYAEESVLAGVGDPVSVETIGLPEQEPIYKTPELAIDSTLGDEPVLAEVEVAAISEISLALPETVAGETACEDAAIEPLAADAAESVPAQPEPMIELAPAQPEPVMESPPAQPEPTIESAPTVIEELSSAPASAIIEEASSKTLSSEVEAAPAPAPAESEQPTAEVAAETVHQTEAAAVAAAAATVAEEPEAASTEVEVCPSGATSSLVEQLTVESGPIELVSGPIFVGISQESLAEAAPAIAAAEISVTIQEKDSSLTALEESEVKVEAAAEVAAEVAAEAEAEAEVKAEVEAKAEVRAEAEAVVEPKAEAVVEASPLNLTTDVSIADSSLAVDLNVDSAVGAGNNDSIILRDIDEYSISSEIEKECSGGPGADLDFAGFVLERENTLVFEGEGEAEEEEISTLDQIPEAPASTFLLSSRSFDDSEVFNSMATFDLAMDQEAVFGRDWEPAAAVAAASRPFSSASYDVETEPESRDDSLLVSPLDRSYDVETEPESRDDESRRASRRQTGEISPADSSKADETLSEAASILSDINSILADLDAGPPDGVAFDPLLMEDAMLEVPGGQDEADARGGEQDFNGRALFKGMTKF